ncbi:DUF4230 domain-containing protein [Corynebacterium mayonis]|uniref:DUF4230 domain-containing protein n=1 Tax=Corynebacterium mayonis TaxID=3062461 RepID=UPI00314021A0
MPFTGKNFLITYKGRVTAGIKNAELIDVTVDDLERTITIAAPEVGVIDTTIDPGSIAVMDQSLNPLNQLRFEDVSGFLAAEEEVAQQEAVDNGLLDRASVRTEELLRNHGEALTQSTAMSDYTVVVQWK